jgi:hypothetical protein
MPFLCPSSFALQIKIGQSKNFVVIYIFILLILFIFSFVELVEVNNNFSYKKIDRLLFFFLAFFVIAFAALRYKTGGDWYNYISVFERSLYLDHRFEPGYLIMNKIFKYYFNNYSLMQFVINIFSGYCIFRFFNKYSEYPIFSLLLYFSYYFFKLDSAQARQHIAIGIVVMGYKFIEQRRFIPFVLMVIFAMQFHISAVCCIILYFFNRNQNIYFSILVGLTGIIISLWGYSVIIAIIKVIIGFLPFFPDTIKLLFLGYIGSKTFTQISEFFTGLTLVARVSVAFIVILLYHTKKIDKPIFFNSFLFGYILESFTRYFSILHRFSYYFYICGGGIIIYNILFNNRLFYKVAPVKYIFIIFLSFYLSVFPFCRYFWFGKNDVGLLRDLFIPYYSVFNPVNDHARERFGIKYTNYNQ